MTGAALGLVFAKWSSALLVQQLGSTVSLDLALDWRVLVFTATLACLCDQRRRGAHDRREERRAW